MKKKREKSKMHYQIVLDLEPNNKEVDKKFKDFLSKGRKENPHKSE